MSPFKLCLKGVPLLGAAVILGRRAVPSVELSVQKPSLRPVGVLDCRGALSVAFVVQVPLLGTVGILYRWAALSMVLAVQEPLHFLRFAQKVRCPPSSRA